MTSTMHGNRHEAPSDGAGVRSMAGEHREADVPERELLPVGVSIVAYRSPVPEMLQLVQELIGEKVACVYVVDHSADKVLRDALQGIPRTRYLSGHGNIGYGRGHNLAISESVKQHAYHLVCNPDISIPRGTIAELCAVLDRRPEVGLCMPRIVGHDGLVQHLCKRLPTPIDLIFRRFVPKSLVKERMCRYEMRDQSYDEEMTPATLSGCFMFFRATVLAGLGGFDPRFFMYLEDTDLSRRAGQVAVNLYYPRVTVVHGYAKGSYKSLKLLGYHVMSAIRYFNKWGWFPFR